MKPNDMDIDEILKRYSPRATPEEADAAGERVLQRIRALRFSHERSECKPDRAQPSIDAGEEPKGVWLPKFDLAILAAVDELQGRGHPVTITLKVAELQEERIVSGGAVFIILLILERSGLVTSSPDPEEPDAAHKHLFKLTGCGRETLAAARAAAARRAGPLADFA